MPDAHDVTTMLASLRDGDRAAVDALFSLLYDELRRTARRQLAVRGDAHTLGTTVVVHEVYLKLQGARTLSLEDRGHFLALAARAMRQVLVDHARARLADKRGGGARPTLL
ncbi:hypothetical protein KDK88_01975, partial [bacterium]|nr:hypothetical protein [bacterium]